MDFVNVSKWFDEPTFINGDSICGITLCPEILNSLNLVRFEVATFYTRYYSKAYPAQRDAEFAMSEFIKKLEE